MEKDRKPQYTPDEEKRINTTVDQLVEGGQDAIERTQDTRRNFLELIDVTNDPVAQSHIRKIAGMAGEAIERAQDRIEKEGKDRVSQLLAQEKEKKNFR